ncbi:MAG TPA: amidohydrolase family protein [Gammaproteobacteria bacterium]|nr:amidohydrolase family protein [Gammaproteobacteria bacterium]
MRIDAYTHFIPETFFSKLVESGYPDIGKRMRNIPSIYELDMRKRIVEGFSDYAQILSYPMPPIELLAKGAEIDDYAKAINDGFADICTKNAKHFPGWVAEAPIGGPDAGVKECERAIKNGALGVQIHTNIAGKPLDAPEFAPFWETMEKLDKPVWLHPARDASTPDYQSETKSKYEIWWTFGWSYETAAAMARLVFSGLFDKLPNIKIITHHLGGLVPYLEGKIAMGFRQAGEGSVGRNPVAEEAGLARPAVEYFRMFYADTAVNGIRGAFECGLEFFTADRCLFASDAPFDPMGGAHLIREGLRMIDSADLPPEAREKIYYGNATRLLASRGRADSPRPKGPD